MTTRRGFLKACLALGAAPAIVRADSLMRVIPRDAPIVRDWSDWTSKPDIILTGQDVHSEFQRIISETLRKNAPKIARNMRRSNAMLARFTALPWADVTVIK